MRNKILVPQKLKHGITVCTNKPLSGDITQNIKNRDAKRHVPVFVWALFTVAKRKKTT
jgi:hypothetical protein